MYHHYYKLIDKLLRTFIAHFLSIKIISTYDIDIHYHCIQVDKYIDLVLNKEKKISIEIKRYEYEQTNTNAKILTSW